MIHGLRHSIKVVALAGFFSCASQGWGQNILYVDRDASGAGNGQAWCDAFNQLQDALSAAAASNGTVTDIRVAEGTYEPDQGFGQTPGDRLATFTLISGVALRGGYAGCGAADPNARHFVVYETILSGDLNGNDGADFTNIGDNSYHIVTYSDPNAINVLLEGFTVSGGNADGSGAPPAVTNQGGAVHIRNGQSKCIAGGPTLRNCVFQNNWAAHHGAVNDHGLSTIIENCTFRDNFSGAEGSGLQVHSGSPTVTGCTFTNNHSDAEGGGAWNGHDIDPTCASPSEPHYENCVFSQNSAVNGGGMFSTSSSPTLVNCTFNRNSAKLRGGGMYGLMSNPTLTNCLFTGPSIYFGNSAFLGAGMYNEQSNPTLTNCTFRYGVASTNNQTIVGLAPTGGGMYTIAGDVLVQGCTFAENQVIGFPSILGAPEGGGGGMYSEDSTVQIVSSSFLGNFGGRNGSGLYNKGSTTANISNCLFDGNHDGYGGGIAHLADIPLTVANSTFRGNGFGNIGGAIFGGELFITQCVFEENQSVIIGGAVVSGGEGPSQFTNCRFLGNQSQRGGAFQTGSGHLTVTNCVFGGNVAGLKGGAIRVEGGPPDNQEFINCTFFGNFAVSIGDTLSAWGAARPRFDNCLIWSNNLLTGTSESTHFGLESGAASFTIHHSSVQGWTGAFGGIGNIGDHPLFMDADGPDNVVGTQDDDLRIASVSPSVDSGNNAVVTEVTDLNGNARIVGSAVDMGAYEYVCIPGIYADFDHTGIVDLDDLLCLIAGFLNRPDCPEGDIYPCGGSTMIDIDDLLALLEAITGNNLCPACSP